MTVSIEDYVKFHDEFDKTPIEEIFLPFFRKHGGFIRAIYCWGSMFNKEGHVGDITTDFFSFQDEFDSEEMYFHLSSKEQLEEDWEYYENDDNHIYKKLGVKMVDRYEYEYIDGVGWQDDIEELELFERIIRSKYDTDYSIIIAYCPIEDKAFFDIKCREIT